MPATAGRGRTMGIAASSPRRPRRIAGSDGSAPRAGPRSKRQALLIRRLPVPGGEGPPPHGREVRQLAAADVLGDERGAGGEGPLVNLPPAARPELEGQLVQGLGPPPQLGAGQGG